MFDAHVLDMFELGINNFKALREFHVSYRRWNLHTHWQPAFYFVVYYLNLANYI